ncbi:MAG: hypothetical protein M3Q71_05635 [Chloroflexota bacterium]|nr:hypothetical protein [Chloroflexota bacterium]
MHHDPIWLVNVLLFALVLVVIVLLGIKLIDALDAEAAAAILPFMGKE